MANLFRRLFQFKQTRDIQPLTDFLAENEAFKQAAQKIHEGAKHVKSGGGLFQKLDKYLEKELLPQDYHEAQRAAE
jgi:translation elongation factor EF-Ts